MSEEEDNEEEDNDDDNDNDNDNETAGSTGDADFEPAAKRAKAEEKAAAAAAAKAAKAEAKAEAKAAAAARAEARKQAKAVRAAARAEERKRAEAERRAQAAQEAQARVAAEASAAVAAAAAAEAAAERTEAEAALVAAARAAPLPEPLSPSDAAAVANARAAVAEAVAAMDVEDVEAALAALDDLRAHARLAEPEAAAEEGAGAGAGRKLVQLAGYLPALLRATHAQLAPERAVPRRTHLEGAAAALDDVEVEDDAAATAALAGAAHASGAARAEGYYFVKASDKKDRLAAGRQPQAQLTKRSKALVREPSQSRQTRREARNLASALAQDDLAGMAADWRRLNMLKARGRQLRFGRSVIHEWGLFSMEDIGANEMVIEYVGEIIRQSVADDRERRYTDLGIGSSYLFRIDEQRIVDATRCGAIARFMNHSCDPNCYAQIVNVENEPRIVIYSKRAIASGEEITYDYKFPPEDEKIPCYCGATNCRGFLN